MNKTVYFFCTDPERDPAALNIYQAAEAMYPLTDSGLQFAGQPVRQYAQDECLYYFVPTYDVLSHIWTDSVAEVNERFGDCQFLGVVNWHVGANAPENILTVHSIGDVPSGYFANSDPGLYRNMLRALHESLGIYQLEGWTACTEATHWSGILYGNDPAMIPACPVPQYDIEIGSGPESWNNPDAAKAIARALTHVFDSEEKPQAILACGGKHFESAFSNCGLFDDPAVMCAHILPNQWMVSGDYTGEDGLRRLLAAVDSIPGGIAAVSFHDNLAGPYKQTVRLAAEQLGVPVCKHRALRDPVKLKELLG